MAYVGALVKAIPNAFDAKFYEFGHMRSNPPATAWD